MTNFDIYLSETKFASFTEVAVSAEKILQIAPRGLRAQLPAVMETDSYTALICMNELRR